MNASRRPGLLFSQLLGNEDKKKKKKTAVYLLSDHNVTVRKQKMKHQDMNSHPLLDRSRFKDESRSG